MIKDMQVALGVTADGETVKLRLNPHSAVSNPSTLFVDSVTITQE